MTELEDRLRSTFHHVAAQVKAPPRTLPAPAPGGRSRRHRPLLAVAGVAAAVALVAAMVVVADGDEPTEVVAGPGGEAGVVAIESGGVRFVLLDEGVVRRDRCVTLAVDGRGRGRVCVPTRSTGMALDAATVGPRTAVFGVGHGVRDFSGQVNEVATAAHEEVALGEGVAFLTVWDVADASGFVEAQTADDGAHHSGTFGNEESAQDLIDYRAPLPPATAEPPATLVAVTVDGRLVVVDRASGDELRELARYGNPQDPPPPEGVATTIDAVDVSPDGSWVWFSLCCEPAGGTVLRVPIDGSEPPQRVADGYDPTFGSNPRFVATATVSGVNIIDTVGDRDRSWASEDWHGKYQEVSWALNAQTVAVRLGMPDDGQLAIVALAALGERSQAGTRRSSSAASVLPGEAWARPEFRRDGSLVAFDHTTGRVRTIDPGTREPDRGIDLGNTILDLAYDATGEWLLAVVAADAERSAGSIQFVDPQNGNLTTIGEPYRAAAW